MKKGIIKRIFEENKYRKKYNSLKLVYEDLLTERQNLLQEVDLLDKQVKKLVRERRVMRGGIDESKLSNDKRPTKNSKHRLQVS